MENLEQQMNNAKDVEPVESVEQGWIQSSWRKVLERVRGSEACAERRTKKVERKFQDVDPQLRWADIYAGEVIEYIRKARRGDIGEWGGRCGACEGVLGSAFWAGY